ncbi:uncharacterized protein LOC131248837 isoform X2 [Magnolia sinica]|uniref:uncharacterized protein LOC131248837 isoform X2 n=1 Tax=Magnolia sinica TaxID=86752 RepID=UPI00265987EA|nr:uncharacterized protein LOC131248837 isoform X2 [Magnolia sinica]
MDHGGPTEPCLDQFLSSGGRIQSPSVRNAVPDARKNSAFLGAESMETAVSTPVSPPPALGPPRDLITRIFSQLDCKDLLHCSLVCKHFTGSGTETLLS